MNDIRWLINFDKWNPSESEWESLLNEVGEEEATRIRRFNRGRGIVGRVNPDAKSSLLGRLMISSMMKQCNILGSLKRTKEGKPFIEYDDKTKRSPLNFNISHAGKYVSFVMTTSALIGVDVMELQLVPKKDLTQYNISEFFDSMDDCFTVSEWSFVRSGDTLEEQLLNFYTLWTLKESYIKAVGIGLGLSLKRIEFTTSPWDAETATATVLIDGKPSQSLWNFSLRKFDNHVVALATTPNFDESISSLRDVLPTDTLGIPSEAAAVTSLPFTFISVSDLGE